MHCLFNYIPLHNCLSISNAIPLRFTLCLFNYNALHIYAHHKKCNPNALHNNAYHEQFNSMHCLFNFIPTKL